MHFRPARQSDRTAATQDSFQYNRHAPLPRSLQRGAGVNFGAASTAVESTLIQPGVVHSLINHAFNHNQVERPMTLSDRNVSYILLTARE
eukprot:357050-Chlamydomonas_euryale.AAC.3